MDVERRLSWLEHELRRIGRLFDSMTAGGVFNVPQGRTVLGAFEGRPATAYSMDKDGNLVCTTVTADYVLGSLTGQTWQGSGAADMTVDLNRATTGTLYVKNTVTAQSANLDVEGNVTVGGTVDGVDVSAHAANNSAHHAPITLGAGSAAELSLLGQELILSDVLTPTEHTAIGDSSPHHAAVTLAASADELLGLSTQALSLDVQAAHEVLIGPLTGAPAAPTFRVLDPTDLPALSANPTASVGLTVVNGSAATLMRSDAAPPLSQAIAPTWTGKHTWQPAADAQDYLRVLNSAGTATIVQVDTLLKWVGVGAAPIAPLSVTDALQMPQFSIQYDASHYGGVGVDLGGNLTLTATGDLLLDPTGNDVLPATGYDLNLGSLSKKYLTLHAAELWVETLVAQDTIATIGGRILVGPTTVLTVAAANGDTSITVKHNQLSSGDRVYLEADGHVEFMAITSAASGSGPYTYNVTRDLDGTGANDWAAGDAVFNTGQAGKGFIDLYSVSGVKSGAGPTIVGNVRNSATYNDWTEHWAIGNLNGVYGYGTDVFGFAAGKYASGQPWIAADATNGFRIMRYTTQLGQWDTSGNITVGNTSDEHVSITPTTAAFKDGATELVKITGGAITVGQVAAGQNNIYISAAGAITLRNNTTARVNITAAGVLTINDSAGNAVFTMDASAGAEFTKPLTIGSSGGIYQGTGTFASPTTGLKVWNSSGVGKIAGYNAGVAQWYADTDGKLYAGGGTVRIDKANGVTLVADSAYDVDNAINFENSAGTWFGRLNAMWSTLGPYSSVILDSDTSAVASAESRATLRAICASGQTAVSGCTVYDGTNLYSAKLYVGGLSDGQFELAKLPTAGLKLVFDSDVALYRGAANTLYLGTGDSMYLDGAITWKDATLSRGAANRLDLASGDSFNLVSGALQVNATTVIDSNRYVSPAGLVLSSGGTLNIGLLSEAITITGSMHIVDVHNGSDASDDLKTINGGTAGQLLLLKAASGSRTVVVHDGDGNIKTVGGADRSLDDNDDLILFWYAGSYWHELAFANIS